MRIFPVPFSRRHQIWIDGPRFEVSIVDRQGLDFWFQGSFVWVRPSIRIVTIEDQPETYTDIPF